MVSFRCAFQDDFDKIRRLLGACGLPYQDIDSLENHFVVAESEDCLVGVCGVEVKRDAVLLRSLAVSMPFRGKGLGRVLVQKVMKIASEKCDGKMFILTTTAENYSAALGFRRIAREDVPESIKQTEQFKGLCPKSAICMIYSGDF